MAPTRERKPKLVRVQLEVEDNCGAVAARACVTIPIKSSVADDTSEIASVLAMLITQLSKEL